MIPYLILRVTAFDFASGLIPVNIEHCATPPRRPEIVGGCGWGGSPGNGKDADPHVFFRWPMHMNTLHTYRTKF